MPTDELAKMFASGKVSFAPARRGTSREERDFDEAEKRWTRNGGHSSVRDE
jgi:hypothetical protein